MLENKGASTFLILLFLNFLLQNNANPMKGEHYNVNIFITFELHSSSDVLSYVFVIGPYVLELFRHQEQKGRDSTSKQTSQEKKNTQYESKINFTEGT